MKKLRLHIARFATFLVALQMLNVGLFFQGFENLATPASISDNNIINSVVEYVSEIVLEKVNAVPESHGKNNHDLQQYKHFTLKMVELKQEKILFPPETSLVTLNAFYTNHYHFHFCKEIMQPPSA